MSAASAEDYLRSNEHGTSSCLITDIQMPGMSGADLQAQLIAEGNFTPIIFMTAFDNEKIRARVLKAGAFGYLKKPFDDGALVRCLEKALKTRAPCEVAALDEVTGAADGSSTGATFAGSRQQAASF